MADQYVEVSKKSWGSNILDSFVGLLIGILIFLAAFWVLWTNEGSVDLAQIAKQSIPISVRVVGNAPNGKFVSLSGKLTTEDKAADSQYGQYGDHLALNRKVEMFAWSEKTASKTEDKLGGGSETKTTYTYEKKWTGSPNETSEFKYPEGHANPAPVAQSELFLAKTAKIGAYSVDPQTIELPGLKPLAGQYKFAGRGSLQAPQVGDVRISYSALANGLDMTAFGKLEGGELVPYYFTTEKNIYRAVLGSRDAALAALAAEHKAAVWTMRLVGFLMMWLGLFLFFGPLNAILRVLPFLGTAGRWLSGAITFPVALLLSTVTILISIVAHNIWLLLATLMLIGGGAYWLIAGKKHK
jgi:hypothetical protein